MSRGPDAATLLARALVAAGAQAGCPVEVTESDWDRWASATFTGARHRLTLAAPDTPQLAQWLAELPECEFTLRGHLVADLAVTGVARRDGQAVATIEVLTVEER